MNFVKIIEMEILKQFLIEEYFLNNDLKKYFLKLQHLIFLAKNSYKSVEEVVSSELYIQIKDKLKEISIEKVDYIEKISPEIEKNILNDHKNELEKNIPDEKRRIHSAFEAISMLHIQIKKENEISR